MLNRFLFCALLLAVVSAACADDDPLSSNAVAYERLQRAIASVVGETGSARSMHHVGTHELLFWPHVENDTRLAATVLKIPGWLTEMELDEAEAKVRDEICSHAIYWPVFKAGASVLYWYDFGKDKEHLNFGVEAFPQHCMFLWFRATARNFELRGLSKDSLAYVIDLFATSQGVDMTAFSKESPRKTPAELLEVLRELRRRQQVSEP